MVSVSVGTGGAVDGEYGFEGAIPRSKDDASGRGA